MALEKPYVDYDLHNVIKALYAGMANSNNTNWDQYIVLNCICMKPGFAQAWKVLEYTGLSWKVLEN